jgi:hypothetical protein
MKTALLCLSATISLILSVAPVAAATKVFLMAGQSNMAGVGGYSGYLSGAPWTTYPYGQGPDAPCPAPYNTPNPNVHFWNYTPETSPTDEIKPGVGTAWVDLQNGYGALKNSKGPQFGPELSFGARIKELYPNDDIYLVKYALSSTNLAESWSPNGGPCYNSLMARVNAAMSNLSLAGKNPQIAGMIWMQGEDDATNLSHAQNYRTNLKNFVTDLRSDLGVLNMPFVAGRITYMAQYWAPRSYSDLVRNAQWNISSDVGNASCINTDDLQWAYYGHYGTQGQIDLGVRFANQFSPVPEPSTLGLLAAGLCLIAPTLSRAYTRKRKTPHSA